MRAARISERQALGDDRVDLVRAEQLEQREEVLPEPTWVAGTSTHRKRWRTSTHGKHLVAVAQLLDPVGEHAPVRREQAPESDARGRRVPLDPPSPALAPVHKRGVV